MYWNFNTPYNSSHKHCFDFIGESELAKHLAFIHEFTISPLVNDPRTNADKIWQCRKQTNRLPVLTFDGNFFDNVEQYLTELNQYIDPNLYFVLASDSRCEKSTMDNLAAFPTWLLRTQMLNQNFFCQERKYRISYLSGVARYHRIELFKKIKSYVRPNDIVVINKFCPTHLPNTLLPNSQITNLEEYLSDLPWESRPGLIDTDQTQDCASDQHLINHPGYAACINITGETHVTGDIVLFSEKTWKSYIAGCLTVNFALDNFPLELAKLGIEIWHEYDISGPLEYRMKKIVELFQRDDIENLYKQNFEMVDYNRNLVSSLAFSRQLSESALTKIKKLL